MNQYHTCNPFPEKEEKKVKSKKRKSFKVEFYSSKLLCATWPEIDVFCDGATISQPKLLKTFRPCPHYAGGI